MRLPKRIICGPGQRFLVRQMKLSEGKLGYVDFSKQEIVLESRQSEAGKHQILLHEMMHIAADKIKQAGLVKRHPPESFIQETSGILFLMLAHSGLWKGMSREHAARFLRACREKKEAVRK